MSSASKSNILPRVGDSSTSATKGGETSIFTTDNTKQNYSHNKNDLFFFDVNSNNTLTEKVKSNVFKINNKIDEIGLDPNDDSNTSEYNYLENAINLASCGAWESSDESLCVAPWGDKPTQSDEPYLVNFAKTPSKFRTSADMVDVITNLDKFKQNNSTNITGSEYNSDQEYYNGMFYMINKYLLAKSRFYNSANKTSSSKPGLEQLIDIFTGNSDYNVGSTVKIFLFIVVLLSIYLILRGLSTITSIKSTGTVGGIGLIVFIAGWLGIIFGTVLSKTDKIKNYYTLFTGKTYKLNEPCENSRKSTLSNVKYYISAFSVFAIIGFIKLVEKLDSKNSSAIIYGFNFLLIIAFSFFIAFVSSPTFLNKSSDEFKMSYGIDNVNELPYQNTKTNSWFNITFWLVIFILLLVLSFSQSIKRFLDKGSGTKNTNNSKKIVDDIIQPWLRLRGLFIIAFNLLLIYYIPFYLIMYPIICMLQRLAMGSVVLPALLNRIPGLAGNGKSFENMDSAEKLVLFNSFVGWDLPGWSLFKLLDVLEKVFTDGADMDKLMKSDQSEQNTANINVFTEFGKQNYISPLFGVFYSLFPPMFYKLWKKSLNNTGNKLNFVNFLKLLFFCLVGFAIAIWFSSIIGTYVTKKELDLSYPIPINNGSQKSAVITYAIVYGLTLFLLVLKGMGIQNNKIDGLFNMKIISDTIKSSDTSSQKSNSETKKSNS